MNVRDPLNPTVKELFGDLGPRFWVSVAISITAYLIILAVIIGAVY